MYSVQPGWLLSLTKPLRALPQSRFSYVSLRAASSLLSLPWTSPGALQLLQYQLCCLALQRGDQIPPFWHCRHYCLRRYEGKVKFQVF